MRLNVTAAADTPTAIVASGPGVENYLEAITGHYQDFKTRERISLSAPINNKLSKKLRTDIARAKTEFDASAQARATVTHHIWLTPITSSELRIAPMLAMPASSRVLILTGNKDVANLDGIHKMMSRMTCDVRLHVVEGAKHNPFDSKPVTALEGKNQAVVEVIRAFLAGCSAE